MIKILRLSGTRLVKIIDGNSEYFLDLEDNDDYNVYEQLIDGDSEFSIKTVNKSNDNYDELLNEANAYMLSRAGVNPDQDYASNPSTADDAMDDQHQDPAEEQGGIPFSADDQPVNEPPVDDVIVDEDELLDDDERKLLNRIKRSVSAHKKGVVITSAVVAAAVLAGGAGFAIAKNAKNTSKLSQKASASDASEKHSDENILEVLVKNKGLDKAIEEVFKDNAAAKEFYGTLYTALHNFNLNASGADFVLNKDKDSNSALRFTYEEIMSAMLALNDYSEEELYQIFGNTELKKEKLVEDYQSFLEKVIIYSMNGKKALGVDKLVRNSSNKILVRQFESAISAFNQNVNSDNANRIIKYFDYYIADTSNHYVFDKDIFAINNMDSKVFENFKNSGLNRYELDNTSSNYVRNLCIKMVSGFRFANSQGDYKKYRTLNLDSANFDELFSSNKGSHVRKGGSLEDYFVAGDSDNSEIKSSMMPIVDTLGCSDNLVYEHLESIVNSLKSIQDKQNSRQQLLSGELIDLDEFDLADAVLDGLSSSEKSQIESKESTKKLAIKYADIITVQNDAIKLLLNKYFSEFESKTFEYNHKLLDQTGKETLNFNDLDELFNNRIRGYTKVADDNKSVEKGDSSQTRESVTTRTTTNTEKVDKKDLTQEEKKEAEKQEKEIDKNTYQVTINGKTFDSGDKSRAAKQGYDDAVKYANAEVGSYSHADIVWVINSEKSVVINTDETLFDIAVNTYAFKGVAITSSDSQIQARLASDLAKFKNNNNAGLASSYEEGWLGAINQILSTAVNKGAIVRSEAEAEYQKALEEANKKDNDNNNNNNNNSDNNNYSNENNGNEGNNTGNNSGENNSGTTSDDDERTEELDFSDNGSTDEPAGPADPESIDGIDVENVDENMNPHIPTSVEGFEDVYDPDGTYDFGQRNATGEVSDEESVDYTGWEEVYEDFGKTDEEEEYVKVLTMY